MAAFDFSVPEFPIIFDQASITPMIFNFTDSTGATRPLSLWGIRFAFFVDESAVLLELTVANGRVIVADTDPNLVATIRATDTAFGTPMNGVASGRYYIYGDPNGVEDASSVKLLGGGFYMHLLGAVT